MKFWLVLSIAVAVTARIKDGDSSGNENVPEKLKFPNQVTLSDLLRPRFYRDAGGVDNLKTTVSNLKMVARITNGIYLLQELIAGTIPSDELIAELLHFGSVKPSEISGFDNSKIQVAIDDLRKLTEVSKPEGKALGAESAFNGMKAVLDEIDGIGDIKDWKGRQKFLDEMARLSNGVEDMDLINKVNAETANWINVLSDFKKPNYQPTSANFNKIKEALEMVKKAHTEFESSPKPTFKFDGFSSAIEGIATVTKSEKGISIYQSKFNDIQLDDEEVTAFASYMENFIGKMESLYGRITGLNTIMTLLKTRLGNTNRIQRRHTFGLMNGPSDFSMISRDLNDPWIRKVMQVDSLKESLGTLKELSGLLVNMDDVVGRNEKDLIDAAQLQLYFDKVEDINTKVKNAKTGITDSKSCIRPTPDVIDETSVTPFFDTVKSIDTKLSNFKPQTEALLIPLSKSGIVEMCDEIIKICDDSSKATNITAFVKTFLDNETVKKLDAHIKDIEGQTTSIKALKPDTAAATVLKDIQVLDDYLDKMGHYAEYFKCLQNNVQLKSMFEAIDGIQKVRDWKDDKVFTDALTKGMSVVKTISGTRTDLEKLKTSIGALKGMSIPEFNVLEDLKEASKHSMTIGSAVQGISNMEFALEHRKDVMIDVDVVKNNKGNAKPEDAANLDALINLAPMIDTMYSTLDTFKGSVSTFVPSSTLSNQSGIFESAKLVTGVSREYSKMIDSVENLKIELPKGPDTDKLEQVEKALKNMDSMDLDFAKYQKSFDESSGSLKAIDEFLLSYAKKQTPIVATPKPGQPPSAIPSDSEPSHGESNTDIMTLIIIIGASLLGSLILGCLITMLIWFFAFRRNFKKRFFFLWRTKDKNKLLEIIVNEYIRMMVAYRPDGNGKAYVDETIEGSVYLTFDSDYMITISLLRRFLDAEEERAKFIQPIRSDCRYPITIPKKYGIALTGYGRRFRNNFIAAAHLKLPTKQMLILTQGPQLKAKGKNETVSKFWWMVQQMKSENVVMLCPDEDTEHAFDIYFPQKQGEKMKFDDLELECIELKTEERLETRVITAQFGNEKKITVTHYWLRKWSWRNDDQADATMKILRVVLESKTPSVVHCAKGTKYTPTFAHIACACSTLRHYNKVKLADDYLEVARRRTVSLDTSVTLSPEMFQYAASMLLKYYTFDEMLISNEEVKGNYQYLMTGFADIMKGKEDYEAFQKSGEKPNKPAEKSEQQNSLSVRN